MIGNQPAISGHCNSELVVSTGWLVGHEVQFKDATENWGKKKNIVHVLSQLGSTDEECCLKTLQKPIDIKVNIVDTTMKET